MSSPTAAAPSVHDAGFAGFRGLELVRGEGPWVFDATGRRYLDATSMYGVALLGHSHPALTEALAHQAATLMSCFSSYANDRRNALLNRLAELLEPLDRFFLCNSGTEAVEAALKLARLATGRPGVVSFSRGFHGRTFGSASATVRGTQRDQLAPLLEGFRQVRPGDHAALAAELRRGDVGLVLTEVVQGEGGVYPLDGDDLRAVQQAAREAGALFAVDEVQTGVGRTGRWFGYRHHDLDPDFVTLAKGLGGGVPIGAVAFRSSLGRWPAGTHGSTFGGNPLACAAALATLDVVTREGLVEVAARRGERLRQRLRAGCGDRVREVRGVGLMLGLDLEGASATTQRRLQDRGFLVLGAGPRTLRLLPPLITPEAELDRLADAIIDVVTEPVDEAHTAPAATHPGTAEQQA